MFISKEAEEYRKFMYDFIKAIKKDCEEKLLDGRYCNEDYIEGKIAGLEEAMYKLEKSQFLTDPEQN